MKLTKSQLKQIVKEELNNMLNEGGGWTYWGESFGSLEEGVGALIRNWNPRTEEGQKYLAELEELNAHFQGREEFIGQPAQVGPDYQGEY